MFYDVKCKGTGNVRESFSASSSKIIVGDEEAKEQAEEETITDGDCITVETNAVAGRGNKAWVLEDKRLSQRKLTKVKRQWRQDHSSGRK